MGISVDDISRRTKIHGIVALIAMKSTKHWLRKKLFRRLRTLRNTGNIARDREAKLKEIENLPDYVFRSMFR